MSNYLGIILPSNDYEKMASADPGLPSSFRLFDEAAARLNIKICYFKFFDISAGKSSVSGYIRKNDKYVLSRIPIPKAVYTRVLDRHPRYQKHIRSLAERGITVYNVPNYDVEKYQVHQLLMQSELLSPFLPHTERLTLKSLNEMASLYSKLFLKLDYGEYGRGAMKLERTQNGWVLSYKKPKQLQVLKKTFKKTLPKVLQQRMEKSAYLVQELVPLATYLGKPFDMRVAVQKNKFGIFQTSAIMCKVAGSSDYLTNGAHGSKTYRLSDIAAEAVPGVPLPVLEQRIRSFGENLANHLDRYFPHLADLGFDIGITREGKPYFIECNFISDYEGGLFHNGNLLFEEFKPVFTVPIEYGAYLLSKKQ